MKRKLYQGVFALSATLTFLAGGLSCTDDTMDKINEDINHPTSVSSNFIITSVETVSALLVTGGDFNTYLSVVMEHQSGSTGQMYDADQRYVTLEEPSSFNNGWNNLYDNFSACKDIIAICSEGGKEAGNLVNKGIGETLMAYNLAIATDLFGDIPWSEALNFASYMNPKLDKQEAIYKDIFSLLDQALIDLQSGSPSVVQNADVYYGGNVSKWVKAVYALKARYTMRLIGRSSDKTGDLNKILDYVSKSFGSAADELKLDKYDGSTMFNPLYTFSNSRNYLSLSKSLMDKFIARNDPRAEQVAINPDGMYIISSSDPDYDPFPNGAGDRSQDVYSQAAASWGMTAPTQLLSYHELLFLKAEAQVRLNQDASSTLKAAIAAAYENAAIGINASINSTNANRKIIGTCTLTSALAEEYFESRIQSLYKANPLKEVMIEKYLAFFGSSGESVEAYSDYRRLLSLGESFITLANPNNAATAVFPKGHFPLRLAYGEASSNPFVREAQGNGAFVYAEPVWWAGGSR
ncbi:hypothetical protein FACS189415_5640 [Bacteroidia bacterium]|nr:hypothetical protein FACS189415_5640 [Bacteroidia bacterium]